jgi:hypothetical protein
MGTLSKVSKTVALLIILSVLVQFHYLFVRVSHEIASGDSGTVESKSDQKSNDEKTHSTNSTKSGGEISITTPFTIEKIDIRDTTKKVRVALFTMDSIESYERNSVNGGPSGEILIRKCLEAGFRELGSTITVFRDDGSFNRMDANTFDIILLDPWTWAGPGWVAKANIHNHAQKVYILDFFGSPKFQSPGFLVPKERILTAFGSPWNPFLGFYVFHSFFPATESRSTSGDLKKSQQGIIWGKEMRYLKGSVNFLKNISSAFKLVAITRRAFDGTSIQWVGHQSKESWFKLLQSSSFLIGLGNPLSGPSVVDALAAGCVYINPIYNSPVREVHKSQHDHARERIGMPWVCSYHIDNTEEAHSCIRHALRFARSNHAKVPKWFTKDAYLERIVDIFSLRIAS